MQRIISVGPILSRTEREKPITDPVGCDVKLGPGMRFRGLLSRGELAYNTKTMSRAAAKERLRPGERYPRQSTGEVSFTADEMAAVFSLTKRTNLVIVED